MALDMAMEQLWFDFGAAYARPLPTRRSTPKPHRLFLALQPPEDIREEVRQAEMLLRHTYGITAPERAEDLLHISLAGVGEYDEIPADVPYLVSEIAKSVSCARIELTFHTLMRFGGNANVLCGDYDKAEFDKLCLQLEIGLRKIGIMARGGSRNAHMTLFYHPKPMPPITLETPFVWTADEFMLIHSFVGKARHEVLDRWALKG